MIKNINLFDKIINLSQFYDYAINPIPIKSITNGNCTTNTITRLYVLQHA